MARFASSSRYVTSAVDVGSMSTVVAVRRNYIGSRYRTITTKVGDTFDMIAAKTLGDPQRYWEIADINPQVPFPDGIPEGTVLRVPFR